MPEVAAEARSEGLGWPRACAQAGVVAGADIGSGSAKAADSMVVGIGSVTEEGDLRAAVGIGFEEVEVGNHPAQDRVEQIRNVGPVVELVLCAAEVQVYFVAWGLGERRGPSVGHQVHL